MEQLPRHVKHAFYCKECDRSYSNRYRDRHHRTYNHQHKALIPENVRRLRPFEVDDTLNSYSIVRLIPLESFEL